MEKYPQYIGLNEDGNLVRVDALEALLEVYAQVEGVLTVPVIVEIARSTPARAQEQIIQSVKKKNRYVTIRHVRELSE